MMTTDQHPTELASPGTPKASEPPTAGYEEDTGRSGGAEVGPSAGPSPDNQAGGVDAPASHPTLAAGAQGAGESGVGSRFNSGPPAPLYLLWSNKHGMWWRPAACGYTNERAEAGRYSETEAISRVLRSAQCGRLSEVTCMVVAPPVCSPGEHIWAADLRDISPAGPTRLRCQLCGYTTSVPVTRVDP